MSIHLHSLAKRRFVFAMDDQEQIVHVADARKARDVQYFCRGCRRPLSFCKGPKRTPYFRHQARIWAPGENCDYQDESHAHKQAKRLLLERKWVMVPDVQPYPAPGYEGRLPVLRRAQLLEAAQVLAERSFFAAPDGRIFYLAEHELQQPSNGRQLICRPDITFTDAQGSALLLIEIHVTHAVDYHKLVGLQRMQLNTLEITIPIAASDQEIARILDGVGNRKWLYHHEREQHPPFGLNASPAAGLAGGNLHEIPAAGTEAYECQLFELREGIRALQRFMGELGVRDFFAQRERIRAAEERKNSAADAAADRADAAAQADEDRAYRAEYRAEAERVIGPIEEEEIRLIREQSAVRGKQQDLSTATARVQRLLAAEAHDLSSGSGAASAEARRRIDPARRLLEDALGEERERSRKLSRGRTELEQRRETFHRVRTTNHRLAEQEQAAGLEEKSLAKLEQQLAAEEVSIAQQEAAGQLHQAEQVKYVQQLESSQQRAEEVLAEQIEALTGAVTHLRTVERALSELKSRAIQGRFS